MSAVTVIVHRRDCPLQNLRGDYRCQGECMKDRKS